MLLLLSFALELALALQLAALGDASERSARACSPRVLTSHGVLLPLAVTHTVRLQRGSINALTSARGLSREAALALTHRELPPQETQQRLGRSPGPALTVRDYNVGSCEHRLTAVALGADARGSGRR